MKSLIKPDTRRARRWGALALFAALMTTPLLAIQLKQARLIDELTGTLFDSITWQVSQLEREHARLLRTLERAAAGTTPPTTAEMVEHYQRYLGQLALIEGHQRNDLIEQSESYERARRAIDDIVAVADPLFAQPEQLLSRRRDIAALAHRLQNAEPLLGELDNQASRATSLYLEQRIRQQGNALTVLAVLQLLLFLGLAALLGRHISRQRAQYTALKKLSGELEAARQAAERANRAQSVFLTNMSHEVRTPFQGLLGMLNLLDTTELGPEQRDHVATALDSAQHLLGILNDILDISAIDSGGLKLSTSPVDLHEMAASIQELMRQMAVEKSIDFRVVRGERLPRWVQGDPLRIRQILLNLISNAIKFTDQGEVLVTLDADDRRGGIVRIVVEDTGVGMDEAALERLFTRFYQADGAPPPKTGGTGLGLDISRSLARLMGGDITVTSQPGAGSRFVVSLALPPAAPPAKADDDEPIDTAAYESLRLLVAEDHPINLKYMSLLLEKMGHEAVFCASGREALDLLRRQSFDAVLLDYHMPELDGISTARAIRQIDGPSSQVKILLVTADVVNEVRQRATQAGVDRFVSKPLTLRDLNQALQSCKLLRPKGVAPLPPAPAGTPAPSSSTLAHIGVHLPFVLDLSAYQQLAPFTTREVRSDMLSLILHPQSGSLDRFIDILRQGDRAAIELAAHNLKGASMLLGLAGIANAATEIERVASERGPMDVDRWTANLRQLAERTHDEICALEVLMDDGPLEA